MATVSEVTARYENFLMPVLTVRDGVCTVCRKAILPGWSYCYQCNTHRADLSCAADMVAPIALAVKHEQWAYELSGYKNSSSPTARSSLAVRIGAVLWRWLEQHESCVEIAAGVAQFPLVTAVPSTRGRTDHPLPRILTKMIKPISDRYAEVLYRIQTIPPDAATRAMTATGSRSRCAGSQSCLSMTSGPLAAMLKPEFGHFLSA